MSVEKLTFAGHEVIIDSENLRFNEATLSDYIQTESGYFDNFGASLALAERNLQNKEMLYERLYNERFVEAKEGGSDKLAEAKSKSDPDVMACKAEIVDARYIVSRLKQHLKAWDINHDNAQSAGHMQRKMMDKLQAEITARNLSYFDRGVPGLDASIADAVLPLDPGEKVAEKKAKVT